jgi:hypothetical protein
MKKRMSTMNRRAVALVLALIVVGAGTLILLLPQSSSSFHFEADYPEGDRYPVYLWLTDIQDCALNVSFVDDPNFLYEMDVELYESQPASSAFDLTVNDYRITSGWMDVSLHGVESIKSLQVTLGSGVPYFIVVTGTDVNATFIYDNNVMGSGECLDYSASGSFVNLQFTEDVVVSNEGMEIEVGTSGAKRPDNIYLTLDLPDGVNGIGQFSEPLSIHAITGWTWHSGGGDFTTYATENHNVQPSIGITLWAEYAVHVWLSD